MVTPSNLTADQPRIDHRGDSLQESVEAASEGTMMLVFRIGDKVYRAGSALAIVCALEKDTTNYPHRGRPITCFLNWSLERLRDHIPPRDMDLSDRMDDEALALNYLYLRDEYGAGKLTVQIDKQKGKSAADRA